MSSISIPLTYRLRPALQWPAGSGLLSRLLCPFGPGSLYGDPLAQVEYLDSYDLSDPSSFSVTRWLRSIFLSPMTLDIVQLYSDPLDQAEYLDSYDLSDLCSFTVTHESMSSISTIMSYWICPALQRPAGSGLVS